MKNSTEVKMATVIEDTTAARASSQIGYDINTEPEPKINNNSMQLI